MARPIVTLTTDFGLRDPFVGIVKGVILGICPDAALVDLTHEVAPQDIEEGALALDSSWRFFPAGTVHLAVVDPGVGSARRALAVAAGGHYFVGPDNGLLAAALERPSWSAVSIEALAYRLPEVSRTFHGRDVFAPAAAHLACGVAFDRLGPRVVDPVRVARPAPRLDAGAVVGEVIGADRFGNLITSIDVEAVRWLSAGGTLRVAVGQRDIGPLAETYAEGAADAPRAIVGSSGRLEIFVRNGSAAALWPDARGVAVTVRPA